MSKPVTLIFDVNETLLDLSKVKVEINRYFNNDLAFSLWFASLIQYSMTEVISGSYHSFGEVGEATLRMVAQVYNMKVEDQKVRNVLELLNTLPAHSDVKAGLKALKSNGFELIALTNGSNDTVLAQMEYANLSQYFDFIFSTEQLCSFKPHPKTYEFVLAEVNRSARDCMMVAAHPWDIAGAKGVGLKTAFIKRPNQVYYPLLEDADIMVNDFKELTEAFERPNEL